MLNYKYSVSHEEYIEIKCYDAFLTLDEFIELSLKLGTRLKVTKMSDKETDKVFLNLFCVDSSDDKSSVVVYLLDDKAIKTEPPSIQKLHEKLMQDPNLSDYLVTVDEVEVILNLTK